MNQIYLNPRPQDAVRIFDETTTCIEAAGLVADAKILNRSAKGVLTAQQIARGLSIRGDGILVYAAENADAVLAVVEMTYANNRSSFAGRKTSRVPLTICDGFAVANTSGITGQSRTSAIAGLLSDVKAETVGSMGLDAVDVPLHLGNEAVERFQPIFDLRAAEIGFNPNNIAFGIPGIGRSMTRSSSVGERWGNDRFL